MIGHEVGHVLFKRRVDIKELSNILLAKLIEEKFEKNQLSISFNDSFLRKFSSHIQEYYCDLVGRQLFSISFDFSLLKLLSSHHNNQVLSSETHPPLYKRLDECYKELQQYQSEVESNEALTECLQTITEYFSDAYLKNGNTFKPNNNGVSKEEQERDAARDLISSGVAKELFKKIEVQKSVVKPADFKKIWEIVVPELDELRPPFESVQTKKCELVTPIHAQVVATLYYYGKQYKKSNKLFLFSKKTEAEKHNLIREKLIEHLIYAISLYDFVSVVRKDFDPDELDSSIWTLRNRGVASPFIVVPTIDPIRQYSVNAVDLRLGSHFVVSRLTQYTHISTSPGNGNMDVEYFYDRQYVQVSDDFTLHPQSFVLASTLEYVSIPTDYYALVLGRSTWGRLGLNIATATAIGPGFKGCITLELRNLSETPLTLKVGARICQICLIPIPIEKADQGYFISESKYICPTTAEIPKILSDPDWEMFDRFNKKRL